MEWLSISELSQNIKYQFYLHWKDLMDKIKSLEDYMDIKFKIFFKKQ